MVQKRCNIVVVHRNVFNMNLVILMLIRVTSRIIKKLVPHGPLIIHTTDMKHKGLDACIRISGKPPIDRIILMRLVLQCILFEAFELDYNVKITIF